MDKRVIAVLDRIAHPSTSVVDCEQSIAGLRRMLKGKLPSDVIDEPVSHRSYDAWQQEIDDLREQVATVETASAISTRAKQREIKSLVAQISKLQARLNRSASDDDTREFHTYDEVMQVIVKKFGKHHGIPAALAERNTRLIQTDPSIGRITTSAMQTWRTDDRYPRYVVEQINGMTTDDILPRGRWTEPERRFLIDLYSANERQSNQALANACSIQFGRLITECSIKGELNRLRGRGMVTQYRPR